MKMVESPTGYLFGWTHRPGNRRHYVKDEPFERNAIRGVYAPELSSVAPQEDLDVCPQCKRLLTERS